METPFWTSYMYTMSGLYSLQMIITCGNSGRPTALKRYRQLRTRHFRSKRGCGQRKMGVVLKISHATRILYYRNPLCKNLDPPLVVRDVFAIFIIPAHIIILVYILFVPPASYLVWCCVSHFVNHIPNEASIYGRRRRY